MKKRGKLYGVGVGPGDPELITLKANRIIQNTKFLAIPGDDERKTNSFLTVQPLIERIEEKRIIYCNVTMTKDQEILTRGYEEASDRIAAVLDEGEDVAFLTIGDPTIYATYIYIHQRIKEMGYETEIVNGIPSFCAAAARLEMSLCERDEQLHIIPSSYDIDDALKLPGVKVLMKGASKLPEVTEKVKEAGSEAYMVENCCMENERIYRSADEMNMNAGYLSIVIVKD